ncbi:CCDC90 family protein [Methylohalobius crimeensis]|uniref:DUF1640 domain-containing protein n=1 Tax=Methylohalobius crimeensis TaxID=244365 RepID=UPI000404F389|nr:DUF1640 domain-containing protein [Methylohalobius crimeensis]
MTSVIQFYEQLSSAPDDKTRARLIAEAFERMEERYPEVKELATQSGLNETELRLQKEIETVRKEIVEAEGRLAKEIEAVRREIVEAEGRLVKEIESVRKEIEQVRSSTLRWLVGLMTGQTALIIAALFAIAGK